MKALIRSIPSTFLLLFATGALATTRYVDLNSANPTPPFTDWSTAATNIQDAVDAATDGDLILVTDGVYASGSRTTTEGTTNRLVVARSLTIQSVNGPAVTVIDGGNTARCAYLTNGAALAGFTMTNGTAGNGGGVYCAAGRDHNVLRHNGHEYRPVFLSRARTVKGLLQKLAGV